MRRKGVSVLVLTLLCLTLLPNRIPLKVMAQTAQPSGASERVTLDTLVEGRSSNGFRAEAVYLNDADRPFGARLRHEKTGFTLDYLAIQSVPQIFLWVNSFPTSDRGEPHTQEHLLLGKGNVGRAVSGLEDMSLVGSSAFTMQWRTAYHAHTGAGAEVFYNVFERQVDALLHPDYTDEEIRREVSHWGVKENPADKSLSLEEKGTVYQEMVSSYERPASRLFRAANRLLYGSEHPLSFSAGGWPDAIRQMKPEDIRQFHRANYRLGNMGMVASFPSEMPLDDVTRRLGDILNRLAAKTTDAPRTFKTERDLPAPAPAATGEIRLVEYLHQNAQQPGWVVFAYPATLELDTEGKTLLNLFLANVAGDATTNLYKLFVDTKTRVVETGAKSVFAYLDDEMVVGNPIYIALTDVTPANMTPEKIADIRRRITDEMRRIAALPDNSAELAEFNERLRNRVIQQRRALSKFVNSPPGFGFRETDSGWMTHLQSLNRSKGFRKSVTLKPELAQVERLLDPKRNAWRELIARWRLADAVPYAVAAVPSPKLIEENERAARERAQSELARIKEHYKVTDGQEALRRFKAEYEATTAELERLEKRSGELRFLERPPLTLDDQLKFEVTSLGRSVPAVVSTFDNMTSATAGLALRLDGVGDDQLVYLSMLPALLTQTGAIRDGRALTYEQMSEALRKEILALTSYFSTNFRTGRAELVVRGAGNDTAESRRALEWMRTVLTSPNWTPENLPRIRDLVDQTLSELRNRTQGPEEYWVDDPANAYWRQDDTLLLATSSFLTRAHNVHRLRWLLKDAGEGAEREAIAGFLAQLADAPKAHAGLTRDNYRNLVAFMQTGELKDRNFNDLKSAFGALPPKAKALAIEAAKDLEQLLADIPDETLAADWSYLARRMRADLLVPPSRVLSDLDALRRSLLRTGGARLFMIASTDTQKALGPTVGELLATLEEGAVRPAKRAAGRLVEARLRQRLSPGETPVFVGLVNPNTQGGVFLNSAPAASYADADNRELMLDYLASRLYAGGGAHGIFIKTWGAGLAYSNGFRGSPGSGRLGYYAERTPELPQTLRFVINELKKAEPDPGLVEYAVAGAFGAFRSASPYETRGEAMAADIADGLTPDVVRRFRQAVLELRRSPRLSEELFKRMGAVYARVLPGYGTKARDVRGGVFYVIGPDKQLDAYEQYLKTVEGADAKLYRIYPRDYWLTADVTSTGGGR
jgi:Zn-dependent M16 (insulinase) family peptidase